MHRIAEAIVQPPLHGTDLLAVEFGDRRPEREQPEGGAKPSTAAVGGSLNHRNREGWCQRVASGSSAKEEGRIVAAKSEGVVESDIDGGLSC